MAWCALWLLLVQLSAVSSARAEDLADQLSRRGWFAGLTKEQQAWFIHQVRQAPGGELPQEVHFYSLQPELVLYRSSKLEEESFRGPPVPHAVEAGKDDWGGNLGTLLIHRREGEALEVEVLSVGRLGGAVPSSGSEGLRGWLHRSAVRLDSLVLARPDGTYLADLVPALQAGGSRARLALRSRRGRLFLAAQYVKTYRGEDKRWFAFEIAAASAESFLDAFPWPEDQIEAAPEKTLADLPEAAVQALDRALALGAAGYIRHRDGQTEAGQRYFPPLDSKRGIAATEDLLLVDGSFYPNTSPTRP